MVLATCQNCRKEFTYLKAGMERKYCSRECFRTMAPQKRYDWTGTRRKKAMRDALPLTAENWKSSLIESPCLRCGTPFSHRTTKNSMGATYCSKECAKEQARIAIRHIFDSGLS